MYASVLDIKYNNCVRKRSSVDAKKEAKIDVGRIFAYCQNITTDYFTAMGKTIFIME